MHVATQFRRLAMLGVTACLGAGAYPREGSPAPLPPNVCLTSAADTFNLQGQLLQLATAADSITAQRRTFYQLQLTTPGNVSRVTKENDCKKAAAVIDSVAGTPNSGRTVHLWKLGSNYGTESPAYSATTTTSVIFILSSSFKYKAHAGLGGG